MAQYPKVSRLFLLEAFPSARLMLSRVLVPFLFISCATLRRVLSPGLIATSARFVREARPFVVCLMSVWLKDVRGRRVFRRLMATVVENTGPRRSRMMEEGQSSRNCITFRVLACLALSLDGFL